MARRNNFSMPLKLLVFITLAIVSCGRVISVENTLPYDRDGEMVEVSGKALPRPGEAFRLLDENDVEVPYQFTYNGKLIFQASVPANGKVRYRIVRGSGAPVDTMVVGSFRPDRKDDIIWENERSGYRVYGPAMREAGERVFGYDVFTKSFPRPVMSERFDKAIYQGISFHEDHGDGMDVYPVGPTLGCGTAALLDENGEILFPWCWESFEFLDNGPLRMTLRLTLSDGGETRIITCDAGAFLNKVELAFDGTRENAPLVAGIVIHNSNPDAYFSGPGYIGYAELGEPNPGENGEIYCGAVMPDSSHVTVEQGHILLHGSWQPGFTYWFGSAWSKGGVCSLQEWETILEREALFKACPLIVR